MTSRWGPLGWMTLHSISANYPELPSNEDKQILYRYMSDFAETITCPSCKSHFADMFDRYKRIHPEWANSRFDFFVAVCRLHNTVNRRLDKPRPSTLAECIQKLIDISKITSPTTYRKTYLQYLASNWNVQVTGEGFIMMNAIRSMNKIEAYWEQREQPYETLSFPNDANVLEYVVENVNLFRASNAVPVAIGVQPRVGFSIRGGRLRLGGR